MKIIWMLRFNRASEFGRPGADVAAVTADCTEADLQGEKEARLMELEVSTGEAWICRDIVPLIKDGKPVRGRNS